MTFAANLLTDPYLIFIPIPMLWKSSLKLIKKVATTIVLSAGIFILVCATLKSVFLLVVSVTHSESTSTYGYPADKMLTSQDPENGASVANEWGTRETFVAVITTNLPMVFHLLRTWLTKVFGSKFGSSHKTNYKTPSASGGLHTISGRGNFASRKGRSDMDPITIGMTFTESEERMMEDEIKMQNIRHNVTQIQTTGNGTPSSSGIMVSNQIDVTNESVSRTSEARSVREAW